MFFPGVHLLTDLVVLSDSDCQADDFSADEYDVDGSGAVGWYEFVTVWRKAVPRRRFRWCSSGFGKSSLFVSIRAVSFL